MRRWAWLETRGLVVREMPVVGGRVWARACLGAGWQVASLGISQAMVAFIKHLLCASCGPRPDVCHTPGPLPGHSCCPLHRWCKIGLPFPSQSLA